MARFVVLLVEDFGDAAAAAPAAAELTLLH